LNKRRLYKVSIRFEVQVFSVKKLEPRIEFFFKKLKPRIDIYIKVHFEAKIFLKKNFSLETINH